MIFLLKYNAQAQKGDNKVACNKSDSLTLVDIYNATGGAYWPSTDQWLTDSVYKWPGVDLHSDGHVKWVSIRGHINPPYSYPVPSLFKNLSKLEELDISFNYFSGPIPTHLFEISSLKKLTSIQNLFSGEIPSEIGNLTNLESIDFSGNQLEGEIPEEFYNCTKLVSIDFENNKLKGEISSEIGKLTNLKKLLIYKNELTGQLPDELFNLKQLHTIDLGKNSISGTLPTTIGNATALKNLELNNNLIEGEIPVGITNLSNLKKLDLHYNQLSGSLPTDWSKLVNLEILDLEINNLTGEIPTSLKNLTKLNVLNLSFNKLSGTIPKELGEFPDIRELHLSGNQLSGTIPVEIFNDSLRIAHLDNNLLEGTIPGSIGSMDSVFSIRLNNNQLVGELPKAIKGSKELVSLDISNNKIRVLPDLSSLVNLRALNISNNKINFNYIDSTKIDVLDWIENDYKLIYNPQSDFSLKQETIDDKTYYITLDTSQRASYSWYNQGEKLDGETKDTLVVNNSETGAYYCKIHDGFYGFSISTVPIAQGDITLKQGVIAADYDALIAFYNASDGENWENKEYWNSDTLVKVWDGITVKDGIYITKVDLKGKGLSGDLSSEILNLKNIETLDISSNQLNTIPDLSSMTNLKQLYAKSNRFSELPDFNLISSLEILDLRYNLLTFEDIEPIINAASNKFLYSDQAPIGEYKTVSPTLGQNYDLTISTPGDNNTYQWYKGEEEISGATSNTYTIQSFSEADEGEYHCNVKNTVATELELVSKSINLIKAFTVTFNVTEGENSSPLADVPVIFGEDRQITTQQGDTIFYPIFNSKDIPYLIYVPGYKKVEGLITVNDANVVQDIVLEPYKVIFTIKDPTDMLPEVELTFDKYGNQTTSETGELTFLPIVPDEELTYTLVKTGYQDFTGKVTVKEENMITNVDIEMIPNNLDKIQVFPNPGNGLFNMLTTAQESDISITVFTERGKKVHYEYWEQFKGRTLDLTHLDNGVYYLQVSSKSTRRIIKLIIGKK